MPINFNITKTDHQAIKEVVAESLEMSDFRLGKYFGSLATTSQLDNPIYGSPQDKSRRIEKTGTLLEYEGDSEQTSKGNHSTPTVQKQKNKSNNGVSKNAPDINTSKKENVIVSTVLESGKQPKSHEKRRSVSFYHDSHAKRLKKDSVIKNKHGAPSTLKEKTDKEFNESSIEPSTITQNQKDSTVSRIVKKQTSLSNESWAKPYENLVCITVDAISTEFLFHDNLKMRFEDKLIKENISLNNLLPKLEIKRILRKCNERDKKARAKLQIVPDIRHLAYNEFEKMRTQSLTSLAFWREGETNIYFTPPSTCPVAFHSNKPQFLEYKSLLKEVAEKKIKVKNLFENMDKIHRFSKILQTVKQASSLADTYYTGIHERKIFAASLAKLAKNTEELFGNLTKSDPEQCDFMQS